LKITVETFDSHSVDLLYFLSDECPIFHTEIENCYTLEYKNVATPFCTIGFARMQ